MPARSRLKPFELVRSLMTPIKLVAGATAMATLLMVFAIQRVPGDEPIKMEPSPLLAMPAKTVDRIDGGELPKADREAIRKIELARMSEPLPVATERIVPETKVPPIIAPEEEDRPAAPRRRYASSGESSNVCTRHKMRKVMVRGGKSWRCRR